MYTKFKSFVKKLLPKRVRGELANKIHWIESLIANIVTSFPARKLKVIGVTGTSGKSTTTALIAHIFNQNDKKAAYFTTTNAFWGGEEHLNASTLTTERPLTLYKRIKQVKNVEDEYLIIESSAHAIVQHRLAFIPYRGGVFTNLSHDHLDYFGDMHTYAKAKQGLFKMVAKNNGYGVFNQQDDYTKLMEEPLASNRVSAFGLKEGDVQAEGVSEDEGVMTFSATYKDQKAEVRMPLSGTHNVENALAAISCALQEGVSLEQAASALSSFPGVVGRMERLSAPNGAEVLIDFAHTPDAFEIVLSDLRKTTKGSLIAVFGGYGNRDHSIREPFGRIAATYADHIILTEDTLYNELVRDINKDIIKGIDAVDTYKGGYEEIDDRQKAIEAALKQANDGDVIALLGKGHERTIPRSEKNGGDKPWDEIQAVKDAFSKMST